MPASFHSGKSETIFFRPVHPAPFKQLVRMHFHYFHHFILACNIIQFKQFILYLYYNRQNKKPSRPIKSDFGALRPRGWLIKTIYSKKHVCQTAKRPLSWWKEKPSLSDRSGLFAKHSRRSRCRTFWLYGHWSVSADRIAQTGMEVKQSIQSKQTITNRTFQKADRFRLLSSNCLSPETIVSPAAGAR